MPNEKGACHHSGEARQRAAGAAQAPPDRLGGVSQRGCMWWMAWHSRAARVDAAGCVACPKQGAGWPGGGRGLPLASDARCGATVVRHGGGHQPNELKIAALAQMRPSGVHLQAAAAFRNLGIKSTVSTEIRAKGLVLAVPLGHVLCLAVADSSYWEVYDPAGLDARGRAYGRRGVW